MSAKLIFTQVTAVTLGVVGTGLILNAVDKATKYGVRRVPVFEKYNRFTDNIFEDHKVENVERVERVILPVYKPVYETMFKPVVFDDNFTYENFEDY